MEPTARRLGEDSEVRGKSNNWSRMWEFLVLPFVYMFVSGHINQLLQSLTLRVILFAHVMSLFKIGATQIKTKI